MPGDFRFVMAERYRIPEGLVGPVANGVQYAPFLDVGERMRSWTA